MPTSPCRWPPPCICLPGETVTWKVLDRTHLLLLRLPERKKLNGEAVPRPQAGKKAPGAPEQKP